MRAGFPQPPPQLGPSCSCCRRAKARVVLLDSGSAVAAACPLCDRVDPVPVNPVGNTMSTDEPMRSADKVPWPAP